MSGSFTCRLRKTKPRLLVLALFVLSERGAASDVRACCYNEWDSKGENRRSTFTSRPRDGIPLVLAQKSVKSPVSGKSENEISLATLIRPVRLIPLDI
jgi:hypothetical protein